MRNDISRENTQSVSRSPFDWRDYDQAVFLLLDQDAQPMVFPLMLFCHPSQIIGIQEIGVRVQSLEHPPNGRIGQLIRVYILVIIFLE
jgi:hypothetical protein